MKRGNRQGVLDKFQAIQSFWSSFGIPAYDENTVPTGELQPSYPYITYDAVVGNFGEYESLSASIWYYGTSWSAITTKLAEITAKIGRGGIMLPVDGGSLWIKRGSPFAQRMSDDNEMIRRIFINVVAEFITAN